MIHATQGKRWFMETIMGFRNLPYRWGGDDPMTGFDCSGMVVEGLKSVGVIPLHRDFSADGLWRRFNAFEVPEPVRGCLAFWFKGPGAIHVAVCLDDAVCLTADRGGSRTLSPEDAEEQNAFIKIRPIDHRSTSPKFINVFEIKT